MKRHLSLSFVTGLFAIVCYLAFALLAFAHYPLPYSPLNNWLSDLGNPNLNPSGALFYNIGIVATASILPLFFLGLSRWKMANNRAQRLMLFPHAGLRHPRRLCHAPEWPLSDQLPGPPRFLLHVPVYPTRNGVRFFRRRVALSCCPPEVAAHRGCINCSGRYAAWRLAYGLCAGMGHNCTAALLPWPPRRPDQSAGICDEGSHPHDSYQMRLICNRSLERSPTAKPSYSPL